jgi:hypothetical protein
VPWAVCWATPSGGAVRKIPIARRAAAEREEVLPGDAAAAVPGQRHGLAEQLREVGVLVAPHPVGLAPGAEPLDLDPVAGVVLPDQVAAGEADAGAGRQQRPGRPPRVVALQRLDQRGEPRGGDLAARGHALLVGVDALERLLAGAAELADQHPRAPEGRQRPVVAGLVDLARVEQQLERRGRSRLAGSAGGRRERCRAQRALGRGSTGDVAILPSGHGAVGTHDQHARGLCGGRWSQR